MFHWSRLVSLLLIAVLSLATSACGWLKELATPAPPRLFVVLVDSSSSTPPEDWSLYEAAFNGVVDSLSPGDRLVIGLITEASLTRFTAVADRSLESTGIHDDDEDAVKAAGTELKKAFQGLRDIKASRTKILDAFEAATQVISGDKSRQASILVLSDMLENSEQFNFERTAITDAATTKFIAERSSRHGLPELTDVKVFVVGASAKDQDRYHQVHAFWTKYVQAAGATLAAYGRTVPQFRSGS